MYFQNVNPNMPVIIKKQQFFIIFCILNGKGMFWYMVILGGNINFNAFINSG